MSPTNEFGKGKRINSQRASRKRLQCQFTTDTSRHAAAAAVGWWWSPLHLLRVLPLPLRLTWSVQIVVFAHHASENGLDGVVHIFEEHVSGGEGHAAMNASP